MSIIKNTAESLQLYYSLGDKKSFEKMNKLLNENFIQKKEFSEQINQEIELMKKEKIRTDFVHLAHRLYKRGGTPKDFESGVRKCEGIITSVFELRV